MRKIHLVFAMTAFLTGQVAFADTQEMSSSEGTACQAVAKACLDAGYARDASTGKQFWQGCMKPLILGKSVEGVNIDAKTINTCRQDKIKELKNELHEFQKISKVKSH